MTENNAATDIEIDTSNDFMVGGAGDRIVIMAPPRALTPDQALRLAAWLVVLADGQGTHEFASVLEAVKNT